MHEDLTAAVDDLFPSIQAGLERLVAIPSVSAAGFDQAPVRQGAEATATLLEGAGLRAALLEVGDSPPAVFAELPGPAGAPTVLLYAHYDVQPPGDEAEWTTPPFVPAVRDGRLYGRGASDDKSGIMLHVGALTALRAVGHVIPVSVKVIVEGEEEVGSLHMGEFLAAHGDRLEADAVVIADSSNWSVGQPALTTSLRGLVDCVVEVRTAEHAAHSGMFGGPFPDALTILSRLLATLHDRDGRVAVAGLVSADGPALDVPESELRAQVGAVEGLHLIGEGMMSSRLWTRPAIAVLGLDAPTVAEAINQLVPVARAKVSLRLAPGDDPDRAMAALVAHLRARVEWGARLTITPGAAAHPFAPQTGGPAYAAFRAGLEAAWQRPSIDIGAGGTIPLVSALAERYARASVLFTGVGDPSSNWHAPDESQDLGELKRACLAEAIALRVLGGG